MARKHSQDGNEFLRMTSELSGALGYNVVAKGTPFEGPLFLFGEASLCMNLEYNNAVALLCRSAMDSAIFTAAVMDFDGSSAVINNDVYAKLSKASKNLKYYSRSIIDGIIINDKRILSKEEMEQIDEMIRNPGDVVAHFAEKFDRERVRPVARIVDDYVKKYREEHPEMGKNLNVDVHSVVTDARDRERIGKLLFDRPEIYEMMTSHTSARSILASTGEYLGLVITRWHGISGSK
ncbi:MAG: hypothetical protein KGI00_04840 [Candidatus Micrarchaeota archaeon]|nr:hypothetical protein [Candidatus Micrarchaeota archaeon]